MTTPATPDVPPRRARHTLSIASILLIMLLAVSIGSNLIIGVIGYITGTDSLRQAAYDRLIEVRDSRAREVTALFTDITNTILIASRDRSVVNAELAYDAGVQQLQTGTPGVTATQSAQIVDYFRNDFGPQLAAGSDGATDVSSLLPATPAARYLAATYTIPTAADADGVAPSNAGDGSEWTKANVEYDAGLRRFAGLLGYADLLLINAHGTVVYTVDKGIDLGTELQTGPYQYSSLANAYNRAMIGGRLDQVAISDFGDYAPAIDQSVAWVVAPLGANGSIVGSIAVRLPTGRIDDVMTGGRNWKDSGLGRTGETYLVGDDRLMRSISRGLVEAPTAYAARVVASGVPRATAKREVGSGTSLMLQPVHTDAVEAAFDGRSGTLTTAGYLGGSTVAASAPLALPGLNWVVVAQLDTSEAFAPVDDFAIRLAITSAVLVIVVSILSVILAQFAVRPLRRLRDAARRIAAGEQGVQVEAGESDELVDVAAAFNDMSRSLETKADLLEQEREQNEALLRSLMPAALAERYKSGAHTIVDEHQEVTVLFADIVGFEEYGRAVAPEKSLDVLNEIFTAFDAAAEKHGVERVRTTRQGYLASCGLVVPRVDNARRMVEFALELEEIVERFGAKLGTTLGVRAGIDAGSVTSGLVGQSNIVYDLWGDAVSLAFRLQGDAHDVGVFVTQRVIDRIPDALTTTAAGTVDGGTGTEKIWRIDPKTKVVT